MVAQRLGIAVLLAIAAVAGGLSVLPKPVSPPGPAPAPVVVESVLAGVGRADASLLRDFYGALSDIVVRDGASKSPVVKTTMELRNRHEGALRLAFENTGMVGKYPGLGERLDAHLLSAIGNTDIPLDPALREKAARAFRDVK